MSQSKELTERSPLRVLDRSIHGGLGRGNLGVACAGAGAGKSAFLVAVALDHLLAGRQVLHVALDHPVDRVRDYYDEIFAELAATESLEDVPRTRQEIERNRRIHVFGPHTFPWRSWSRRSSSSSSTPDSIRSAWWWMAMTSSGDRPRRWEG
jgi:KaiC/GvpD/RAD55 family RecA-like ATPase